MKKDVIAKELDFKAVRSSGPGGQHVNKVSSKVELSFNITASKGLTDAEKARLFLKLKNRIAKDNTLFLQCEEARSQHKNKELVVKRFFEVLKKALHVSKKRKPTKPTKSSVEKRLKSKRLSSEKKNSRKRPDLD